MSHGIENKRELLAAIVCYWLVALLVYMVVFPAEFTTHLLEVLPP